MHSMNSYGFQQQIWWPLKICFGLAVLGTIMSEIWRQLVSSTIHEAYFFRTWILWIHESLPFHSWKCKSDILLINKIIFLYFFFLVAIKTFTLLRSIHRSMRANHQCVLHRFLPPAMKLGARLCFYACLWFCSQGGRGYPSMCCRFPGTHPGGKLRGLAWGVSRPTPEGSPGPHLGVYWPTPGGSPVPHLGPVEGSGLGGLQAHTWGVSKPTSQGSPDPQLGWSPGPHLGGIQAHTWGSPGPHPGGVSQHALMQNPHPLMATAVSGTHRTGMHSCFFYFWLESSWIHLIRWV